MCIAAVIHKAVSEEYLKLMDEDNPHGGGVAWFQDGAIQFRRGLNYKQIYALQKAGTLKFPYLLHFRWATHGPRVPQLTHPFPVGIRAFMGELEGSASEVIIHNGTWSDYHKNELPFVVPGFMLKNVSDTAVAAFLVQQYPDMLDAVHWATVHATVAKGEMNLRKRGTWNTYEENEYSNLTWLPQNKTWKYGRGWEDYNDYFTRPSQPYRVESYGKYVNGQWVPTESSESKGPSNQKAKDDWDDYIRARYGDDMVEAVNEMMELEGKEGEADFSKLIEDDLISEDFTVVNDYLAEKEKKLAY